MKNVTIYTKDYCPYCRGAKQVLKSNGIKFQEIDVEFDLQKRDEMVRRSGRTTVPQIFFDDRHIGGHDDLLNHFLTRKAA